MYCTDFQTSPLLSIQKISVKDQSGRSLVQLSSTRWVLISAPRIRDRIVALRFDPAIERDREQIQVPEIDLPLYRARGRIGIGESGQGIIARDRAQIAREA